LHGRVRHKVKLLQAELNCIYSCLFTRYGLDAGTDDQQERFRTHFPKEVEAWAKVTISNGDKVHAADSADEDLLDSRDATFVRVRKLRVIQYLNLPV
jgi:hypothetical protein